MRALIVSHTPPQPGQMNGRERRTRLFIDAMRPMFDSFEFVHFVAPSFHPPGPDEPDPTEATWGVAGESHFVPARERRETYFNHYVASIFSVTQDKSFFQVAGRQHVQAIRQALTRAPDIIFVAQLRAMQPVLAARPSAPIVFDMDDVLHRVQWRVATSRPRRLGKLAYAAQIPALIAAERRAIKHASVTMLCSESDRKLICRLGAGARARFIPNAVAMPAAPTALTEAATVLYLGYYDYEPNFLAATRLIKRIWPRIRAACPTARLLLAGHGVERLRAAGHASEGIEYLGFVPDLAGLYAQTKIVCCPLEIGGGTRVKLIEAAAHARPMVSTRIGAENLDFRDGTEIMLRDDDAGFADACIALLADRQACIVMGTAARERAQLLYESDAIGLRIRTMIENLLGTANGAHASITAEAASTRAQ